MTGAGAELAPTPGSDAAPMRDPFARRTSAEHARQRALVVASLIAVPDRNPMSDGGRALTV
jgi:hypothetical protein